MAKSLSGKNNGLSVKGSSKKRTWRRAGSEREAGASEKRSGKADRAAAG